jgi:hypothetical protein
MEVHMLRRKSFLLISALIILVFGSGLVSCGGPDQKALDTYLKAVRNKDKVAMAAVSSVDFPETVQSWEVVEIGAESIEPNPLKNMARTLKEAEMDLKYIAEKDYLLLSDNQHHYKRYKAALEKDPDTEFKGELAEFHKEYTEIRSKGAEMEKAVEVAKRAYEREKLAAGISLMGGTASPGMAGEVAVKQALVNIVTSAGEKPYRITLKNYQLINPEGQVKMRSRWIVTSVEEGT